MLDTMLDPANESATFQYLQLVKDDEFLAETLALSSGTGQVFDSEHSDVSISDIDISALF